MYSAVQVQAERSTAHLNVLGGGAPEGQPVLNCHAAVLLQVTAFAQSVPRRAAARLERRRSARPLGHLLEVGPLNGALFVHVCKPDMICSIYLHNLPKRSCFFECTYSGVGKGP